MATPAPMFRNILQLCLAACLILPGMAHAEDEAAQESTYVRCMLKRGVNPKAMTREDVSACNKEANVVDPGDEKRDETGAAWRQCVMSKAADLDDGVSPASEIARAVVPHCIEQWRAYAGSFYMMPGAKRQFVGGVNEYGAEAAVQGVLVVRKRARPNR